MVLKFFDVVLKFEPPNARFLNFPKYSAPVLIRLVLINGDCVYYDWLYYRAYVKSTVCQEASYYVAYIYNYYKPLLLCQELNEGSEQ